MPLFSGLTSAKASSGRSRGRCRRGPLEEREGPGYRRARTFARPGPRSPRHGVLLLSGLGLWTSRLTLYCDDKRRVTNFSATRGWMPTVESGSLLMVPILIAIAIPWMISAAFSPTVWAPKTSSLLPSTTSLTEAISGCPVRLWNGGWKPSRKVMAALPRRARASGVENTAEATVDYFESRKVPVILL